MRFVTIALLVLAGITARANDWGVGVPYLYDGAGNIRQIGSDSHVYDAAGRLVQSDTNGVRRNYTYDAYGNRKTCTQPDTDCQSGMIIEAAANRISGAGYDAAGNLTAFEGHTYSYDAFNMQTRDVMGPALIREYIYTADDERIAVYTPANGTWRWTLRDASGKVLRELASSNPAGGGTLGTASWSWIRDYVYRDGLLLASRQLDPGTAAATTYRYHLDHLGTPRRVTDSTNHVVGQHNYHAFGPETSGISEPSPTPLKYTGHERDGDLDSMHARYYDPDMGRFLSVDPVMSVKRSIAEPQSWNRFTYAVNNPINRLDPDGRIDDVIGPSMMLDCQLRNCRPDVAQDAKDARSLASMSVSFIPYIGDAYDALTAISGRDHIGGDKVPTWARVMGVLTPFVGGGLLGKLDDLPSFSRYEDVTKGRSVPNHATDVSRVDFGRNLEANGFSKSTSQDGTVAIYQKDNMKYTVRDTSSSTGGPTAEVFKDGELVGKIRLEALPPGGGP